MSRTKPKPPAAPTQADYLGAWIDTPASQPAAQASSPSRPSRQAAKPRQRGAEPEQRQAQREAEPGRRTRVTLYIDRALYAEIRGAAVLLAANGLEPGNVSALVESALARELERLRGRFNAGKPFPSLAGLPGGRPPRSR